MNIFTRYLTLDRIITPLRVVDKEAALREMSSLVAGDDLPAEEVLRGMLHREEEITTGIGYGIAIPHFRYDGKLSLRIALGVPVKPLSWESFDNRPVCLIFAILGSLAENGKMLELFSQMMKHMQSSELRQRLIDAPDPQELFQILEAIGTEPQS